MEDREGVGVVVRVGVWSGNGDDVMSEQEQSF